MFKEVPPTFIERQQVDPQFEDQTLQVFERTVPIIAFVSSLLVQTVILLISGILTYLKQCSSLHYSNVKMEVKKKSSNLKMTRTVAKQLEELNSVNGTAYLNPQEVEDSTQTLNVCQTALLQITVSTRC